MHSSQRAVVPDPTRILELPVHLRPTTIAPSPALVLARGSHPPASMPAPATPTANSTHAITPASSTREPSEAFALLRRVYLQRDLRDAIAVLQSGLGELLDGRAVLVLFDANDQPWSPITDDLRAAVGVAGVEAIRAAAHDRRIEMIANGRGFAAPTTLARTAAIVAWRAPSAAPLEAELGSTIGAIASRLGVLDHFIADHEANLRVAAEIKARASGFATVVPPRTRPTWPVLAIGALLSISLGLIISAALIQVPTYSHGRVAIHMPSTNVMATAGGRVVERLVVANQRVSAGEPLLRLDATQEAAALAEAESAYRAAMAAYLSDPADPAARARLGNASLKRDVANDRLARRSVYASIDGVVRSIRGDDTIEDGQLIATIVPDGGEPTAMAFMPASDGTRIEPGMTLQVSITGFDPLRIAVTEVEPSASFVRVKARLPRTMFTSSGLTYELHDGQGGVGEIQVGTRSFLSVVLGGDE